MSGADGTFGVPMFGEPMFGGEDLPPVLPTDYTRAPYTLQITDENGATLFRLETWIQAFWDQKINGASEIRFSVAYDDKAVDSLTFPHFVELYDKFGYFRDRCIIARRNRQVTDSGTTIFQYDAVNPLAQLGLTTIEAYTTGDATPTAITTILDSWFALQNNGKLPDLTIGTIDSSIGTALREIKVQDKSILAALRDLYRTVGGYYGVNTAGQFFWVESLTATAGLRVEMGHNMRSFESDVDWFDITNQVIARGKGAEPGVNLLTKTVDDSASQSAYGIMSRVFKYPKVYHQSMLDDIAASLLERLKDPVEQRRLGVLDLSLIDSDIDQQWYKLELGATVIVIYREIDENLQAPIMAMRVNLRNPLDVQIEATNATRTLEDIIADLLADKNELTGDTGGISSAAFQILLDDVGTVVTVADLPALLVTALGLDNVDELPDIGDMQDDYTQQDGFWIRQEGTAESGATDIIAVNNATGELFWYDAVNTVWRSLTHGQTS
ncbi:MAG: phage tail protein [Gammaproteobacteria bacterium]